MKSISDLVLERFHEFGDKIALIDGATGNKTSYKQLKDQILHCAAGWQERGLHKYTQTSQKVVVALYAPNLPLWPVCFHGVLKAGGILTTLNPAYQANEVEHALQISKAQYIVTTPELVEAAKTAAEKALPAGQIKEVFVFGEQHGCTSFDELLKSTMSLEPVKINPQEDVAVLPYSSGTTGLPKAVKLSHFNLTTNCLQCKACVDMTPDDVLCAILPFFHIYGMTVIMNCAMQLGATIVTMEKFEPAKYLENLKSHGVTIAHVAPPVVSFLAKHPVVDKYLPLPKLKEIFVGAAPLGQELAQAAVQRLQLPYMRQGYGMTEMAPSSHISIRGTTKYGSIGRLVPNMTCMLVHPETGKCQDVGDEKSVGEIWLKGPNNMLGYLANPKATSETIDEDGWLRTGDIAYVDKDGDFWIVDRLKELIKVKGFQVAPAELEDLLAKHEEVVDAAVIGVAAPREGDGQVPKAFVVKKEGSQLTEDTLKAWVKERVVSYKCLGRVEFIEKVPKSASGKILRKDLRAKEGKTFA